MESFCVDCEILRRSYSKARIDMRAGQSRLCWRKSQRSLLCFCSSAGSHIFLAHSRKCCRDNFGHENFPLTTLTNGWKFRQCFRFSLKPQYISRECGKKSRGELEPKRFDEKDMNNVAEREKERYRRSLRANFSLRRFQVMVASAAQKDYFRSINIFNHSASSILHSLSRLFLERQRCVVMRVRRVSLARSQSPYSAHEYRFSLFCRRMKFFLFYFFLAAVEVKYFVEISSLFGQLTWWLE